MSDEKRPDPEGVCWDEAWRQRQRADTLEGTCKFLTAKATTQAELILELEHQLRVPFGAADVRALQTWLGVTGSVMTDVSWEKLDDATRRLYVLEVVKLGCEDVSENVDVDTDWRYGHGEIEAACGGETAQMVRREVMERRARILAELAKR